MQKLHLGVVVAALSLPVIASADPRPFTFSNDTYPVGKGGWEYEQQVTWRKHKEADAGYDRVDFRHEFEFGVADTFDLALYLPSWNYEDSKDRSGVHFGSVDVEGIFYFSNPLTDPVGLGLYGEVRVGEGSLEFENKLLVQKDVGRWTFLYNLIVETEIEGAFRKDEENEIEGVLGHSFGATCAVAPGWFVGAEGVVESVFPDWSEYEHTTAYFGPVLSYQGAEHWWATVTPVYQLTDTEDEPDFQLRMIVGLMF
jgi:hypothetical protein